MPANATVNYVSRGSLKKKLPYDRIFGALASKDEIDDQRQGPRAPANLYDYIADINQQEALGKRKTVVRRSTKSGKVDRDKHKCQSTHKVSVGNAPHVQSYKSELMYRDEVIREHIQDEYCQLDNHKALMELAEARAMQRERQAKRELDEAYRRGRELRHRRMMAAKGAVKDPRSSTLRLEEYYKARNKLRMAEKGQGPDIPDGDQSRNSENVAD